MDSNSNNNFSGIMPDQNQNDNKAASSAPSGSASGNSFQVPPGYVLMPAANVQQQPFQFTQASIPQINPQNTGQGQVLYCTPEQLQQMGINIGNLSASPPNSSQGRPQNSNNNTVQNEPSSSSQQNKGNINTGSGNQSGSQNSPHHSPQTIQQLQNQIRTMEAAILAASANNELNAAQAQASLQQVQVQAMQIAQSEANQQNNQQQTANQQFGGSSSSTSVPTNNQNQVIPINVQGGGFGLVASAANFSQQAANANAAQTSSGRNNRN